MEKYLKDLHPIFKETKRLVCWESFNKYINHSSKVNTLHPHTEWSNNFYRSDYFQKNNLISKYKKKIKDYDHKDRPKLLTNEYKINLKELVKYETNQSQLSIDKVEDFMLKSLPIHNKIWSLGINHYRGEFQWLSRFSMCKMNHEHFPNQYKDFKTTVKIIEEYNKTGKLKITKSQEYLRDRYHDLMNVMWGFAEVGIGDKILDGLDVLLEFEKLCGAQKRMEDQFWPKIDLASGSLRRRLTLLMIKSSIYKGLGEDKKRIKVLNEIINMHSSKCNFRPIQYYVGVNRLTEAALSLYKLQPTKENKQRILEYYISAEPQTHDHYESPRERALITFEILKTFGHIE